MLSMRPRMSQSWLKQDDVLHELEGQLALVEGNLRRKAGKQCCHCGGAGTLNFLDANLGVSTRLNRNAEDK